MAAGARLAASEINARATAPVRLELVHIDPGGNNNHYIEGAKHLLGLGLRHVVGCYTSSSRKDVLPLFEKTDAMLWYPSHYEGFETAENIVYSGAAPNQHVLPLARHLLSCGRRRGWFVGSNYIWAWENNRILRETITAAGGEVIGERYFAIGETDLDHVIAQIIEDRPDFVFTTLIGSSLFSFIKRMRSLAREAGIEQPAELPICSCSLSEAELPFLGDAAEGHLSSSVYFSTVGTPENTSFSETWSRQFPELGHASADGEATYIAVHLLADAVARAGTEKLDTVRAAIRDARFAAPQGEIMVDPENLHCWMRPRIGLSKTDGTFELVYESPRAVRPDPYLTWDSETKTSNSAELRVVK
jgi:branched-chain amino acid transport system substrate-binding protein